MAINEWARDEGEDDFSDDEYSDEDFEDDDEEVDTIPCPNCQQQVYDQAERCPSCGYYLSQADRQTTQKSWWIVITVIACLGMIAYWIFGPAL